MLLIVSGHKIIISFKIWFIQFVLNFGASYNKFPQIQISSQMMDKFQNFSKYKHFIRVKKVFLSINMKIRKYSITDVLYIIKYITSAQ